MTTKISAMTAATAAMSFVPAIDATPANWKVPVNAAWGLHQFDGSGNLNPTADNTGTLGALAQRWTNLTLTASPAAGLIYSDGVIGNVAGYTSGLGPTWVDKTVNKTMRFSFQSLTATRTVVWPDSGGTVTLLGNTATGTGNVVLASAPSIDSPTFTTTATGVTQAAGTNSTALATTAYVDRYTPANPQASAPTTGGTVSPTITGDTTVVQINPAGTLANLTLTLPVGTQPGQTCFVAFSQAITALSVTTTNVTATNGLPLPTTATANQCFAFVWSGSTSKWTRFL